MATAIVGRKQLTLEGFQPRRVTLAIGMPRSVGYIRANPEGESRHAAPGSDGET